MELKLHYESSILVTVIFAYFRSLLEKLNLGMKRITHCAFQSRGAYYMLRLGYLP